MQNIDVYYESIKQVFDQILRSRKRKQPLREKITDWLVGVAITAFILSLIPILPVIFVSHIDQHVENPLSALRRVVPSDSLPVLC
jgi:hypothetical protein